MARDHRKLDAFKLADQLVVVTYQITSAFPVTERFGLQSQLRRAAVSIPTNIVEGCAREPEGDYLRFLEIAFASARELLYVISVASRLAYLDEKSATESTKLGDRVAGALVNLRRSIRKG
jgi:four helix bundle protein